ncbi:MAG: thiamine-phosphate kinase [Proteobacteria bacterium]|nr:thiamine-phosphate kinase [Pseudomonadota bacterium]
MAELALEPPSSDSEPLPPRPSIRPIPPHEDSSDLEQEAIDLLLQRTNTYGQTVLGVGDDAAVLTDGWVITVDTLVEGTHFDSRLAPDDVGFKSVAVSVSDLASMGASPKWMVLALSLPQMDRQWIEAFADGLAEASAKWKCELVGGDTTRSTGPKVISVTMGGRCHAQPATRSRGKAGHTIWVTGTPGLAGAGYLLASPPAAALAALRRPSPPLEFAIELVNRELVGAMMDLSDGLATDLPRLAKASGVGAIVEPSRLPVHAALSELGDPLPLQVAAGDDYQLLFTARPEFESEIYRIAAAKDVLVSPIGELTADPEVMLAHRPWPEPAFSHFQATR